MNSLTYLIYLTGLIIPNPSISTHRNQYYSFYEINKFILFHYKYLNTI